MPYIIKILLNFHLQEIKKYNFNDSIEKKSSFEAYVTIKKDKLSII